MCGIAGIRSFGGRPVSVERLEAMSAVLRHRGPDDLGLWADESVGLAHRRLSIIDLEHSHQPMASQDGRWLLAFNGEIFNYRELRAGLDYQFRTDGDTETILAGIVAQGIPFVERMVGQFALALVDRTTGTTYLVRDRLGVLPLYYHLDAEQIVFGSEIKAVLAGLGHTPAPDLASLDAYLTGRSVPAPHSLFEGVRKLPAAHYAVVTSTGQMRTVRYWTLPEEDAPGSWTAESAVEAVGVAVDKAVRSAMVADVPVGSYLSGGVDSSLITATAARLLPGGALHTFAAGFGDPREDELPSARRVSEHVRTQHHEVLVKADDFTELWPVLTWHRDAPVSQPADIAVFRLAQAAREHVSVILSGEGGDELFAGYPKHRAARATRRLSAVPGGVRATAAGAVERRLGERWARQRIALRVLGERTPGMQSRAWFAPFTTAERRALLAGLPQRPPLHPASGYGGSDPVRALLVDDLESWLPDNLLERGDRMSMAASLELRPPLLDHRLVELAFRLPSEYKVRRGTTKWALKQVARRVLPDDVVDRRKVGFRVPLDAWFRSGLRDTVRDRLTGPTSFVAQTFDPAAVRRLVERHESGRFDEEPRIFTLLSLQVWHETFFGPDVSGGGQVSRPCESSRPVPSGESHPGGPAPGPLR
ncbi:asparagine synthase (glutamine-hydrolyzing) [uncultured Ornithinimicrobium sp.]|uniref:asparagine synthase (glutamine-hydrolyzing) n=1 Tax=uncultured Ornithinimicrobium sp. TaxID=259307 RepID=UPI0025928F9D|nr:asparagine synthase (glutamine-hydrolyzing) [uncultured Ornithinimicrobium sp.]